jgi:hypothetical protein
MELYPLKIDWDSYEMGLPRMISAEVTVLYPTEIFAKTARHGGL